MALTKITTNAITDQAVEKAKIKTDAIDATRIADDAVSEEHLDVTAITGNTELSAVASADDVLLVYDTSSASIKKIQASNINSAPTITSISPTNALGGDGTGNHTFTITGTNYNASATAFFLNNSGTEVAFDTVTRNSLTQITGVIAKSSLPGSGEPYDIVVENPNGQRAIKRNQVNVDQSPAYVTAAGSLGSITGGSAMTAIDIIAADPDSAGVLTFEKQSGTFPAGLSTATVNENGVSKFRFTGTPTNPDADTTFNFTLRAVDAASNTSSRAFSITVTRTYNYSSFTSSGTFAVPSGVTNLAEVLVVAGGGSGGHTYGGGGGAGGLVFMPNVPVVASGTVAVTVGDAGASVTSGQNTNAGQDSVFGASPSPGTTVTLTAKGGGGGGYQNQNNAQPGGSGGGAGRDGTNTGPGAGGSATQPTQSGNSGAYGFGSAGGSTSCAPSWTAGGGGGGAGAAGGSVTGAGNPTIGDNSLAGPGGVGKAYTIADGTTSVYYAGGGGGSRLFYPSSTLPDNGGGCGGQGGGGRGAIGNAQGNTTQRCTGAGQANKGGGGGGGLDVPQFAPGVRGYSGGKGVVIVKY